MEKETKTLLAIGAVGIVAYLLLSKRKPKTEQSLLGAESTGDPATNVAAPNNGYPLNLLGAFESTDPFAGLFVTDSHDLPAREDVEAFSASVFEMPADLALRLQQWVNAFNRIADPTLPLLDEDGVAGPATEKAICRALATRRVAQDKYESAGYDWAISTVLGSFTESDSTNQFFYRIHLPTTYNFKLLGFHEKYAIRLIAKPLIVTEAEAQAIRAAGSGMNYYCSTLYPNTGLCVEGVYTVTDNWKNGEEDAWNYVVPTNIGTT